METIIGGANGAGDPQGPVIKESDIAGFPADVIEASKDRPVIVDFWAEWCGPCKTLGPLLEQAVTKAGGAVAMVKIDVDANQALAQQLQIKSIPAVFAFKDGQPVDAFQGALPESQLQKWIDQLIEKHGSAVISPVDAALTAAAEALEAGDHNSASALYGQVMEREPGNVTAIAGTVQCLIALGEAGKAKELLDSQDEETRAKPEILAVLSELELTEKGAEAAGRLDELQAAIAANSDDHQARYDLSLALYANGDAEGAMNELLEIISKNLKWNDEAARLELLKIFEALGFEDERVAEARRRLSSILFS